LGLLILVTLLLRPAGSSALEEEEIPLSDWTMESAVRLHSVLPFQKLDPWSRPFTRGQLAREVIRARVRLGGKGDASIAGAYLVELEEELAPEMASIVSRQKEKRAVTARGEWDLSIRGRERGALRGRFLGDLAVRLAPRLFWHQRVEIDSDGEDDPDFLGKGWEKGVTGTFTHAYLAFRLPYVRFTAGRRQVGWGNGLGGTLLLQGAHPPFDQVGVDARWGPLRGHAFVASLDPLSLEEGAEARRFLSAHRVSLLWGDRLQIGLSETVLYGGEDRGLDWGYANPLMVYYAIQWNRGRDDNVLWSADAYLRLHRCVDLFGEFLADDFQYDMETEPNQIGFLVGVRLKNLPRMPGLFVDAEYVRVNNWVYGHEEEWNRYTYGSALLGHPIGPDGDRVTVRVVERIGARWQVGADFEHRRRGEGRIDDPRQSAVPEGTSFLTGDVTKTNRYGFEVNFAPEAGRRFFFRVERSEPDDWAAQAGLLLRLSTTRPL